jgi:hypothetical protein
LVEGGKEKRNTTTPLRLLAWFSHGKDLPSSHNAMRFDKALRFDEHLRLIPTCIEVVRYSMHIKCLEQEGQQIGFFLDYLSGWFSHAMACFGCDT